MPRFNETNTDTAYFEVDNVPYQKGEYRALLNSTNETFGIYTDKRGGEVLTKQFLFGEQGFADWTNQAGTNYGTFAALLTDLKAAFFFS